MCRAFGDQLHLVMFGGRLFKDDVCVRPSEAEAAHTCEASAAIATPLAPVRRDLSAASQWSPGAG